MLFGDRYGSRQQPVCPRYRRNRLVQTERAGSSDLFFLPWWLYDLPKRPDQLYPILVVGGGPIPLLVLFDDPHSGVGEELKGGPDLFGGRDVVGVLHTYDDPSDVLRRLHGAIGAFEGPDDREEGLPGISTVLNGFVEEIKPVILEGPGTGQESKGLLRGDGVSIPAVRELYDAVDGEEIQPNRVGVVDNIRCESWSNHDSMVGPPLVSVLIHIGDFLFLKYNWRRPI